jgi:ABC-type bacteriocin/lantibiotic exporter with double-glycine peptidase domain
MVCRNHHFLCALALTLSQQFLLALSTYYIAQAGAALAREDIDRVLHLVSLFFMYALAGYITSAMAAILTIHASNQIWKDYSTRLLSLSTTSLQYASDSNRKSIAQWLGGEAHSTIAHACEFHLDMVSICLNIAFTLAVFYMAVGWEIASAIAASLVISFAFAMALRRRIENTAGEIQQRRLQTLLGIEPAWTSALFGTRKMRAMGFGSLDAKRQRYFREVNRYVLLEQTVACCPILIATLALLGVLRFTDLFTASLAGALVAMLPRSLQVLGNVHALSVYLSQFFLVRTRLRNLEGFFSGLEKYEMHGTSLQVISVHEKEKPWQPSELMEALQRKTLSCGRFKVTGANGSGKSTFLKLIKDLVPDSLLLSAEVQFLDCGNEFSTGQGRIKEIEHAISMAPSVLMVDEWDANLDEGNSRRIDRVLEEAARGMVVVEVRHSRA